MRDFFVIRWIRENRNLLLNCCFWGFLFVYVAVRVAFIFSTNYDQIVGEDPIVWNLLNIVNGAPVYGNPEDVPFDLYQYAPLSQLFYSSILKLLQISSLRGVFIVCRFVSFLWNILTAYVVFKTIRFFASSQKRETIFWLAVLTILVLPFTNWSIRPDSCSMALIVISICCSMVYMKTAKIKFCFVAAAISALAFYARQDAIQLLVIVPFAMLCVKKVCSGLCFVLSYIFFFALFFIVFYFISGEFFIQKMTAGVVNNPIAFSQLLYVVERYFHFWGIVPVIILFLAGYILFTEKDSSISFLALVILGMFVFITGSTIRVGSGFSYYGPFTMVGILLIGIFLEKHPIDNGLFKTLYLFGVSFFFFWYTYHYVAPAFTFETETLQQKERICQEIRNDVEDDAYIYVQDPVIKMLLWDRTIMPDGVGYYDIAPYDYSRINDLRGNLYKVQYNNDITPYGLNEHTSWNQVKSYDEWNLLKCVPGLDSQEDD